MKPKIEKKQQKNRVIFSSRTLFWSDLPWVALLGSSSRMVMLFVPNGSSSRMVMLFVPKTCTQIKT